MLLLLSVGLCLLRGSLVLHAAPPSRPRLDPASSASEKVNDDVGAAYKSYPDIAVAARSSLPVGRAPQPALSLGSRKAASNRDRYGCSRFGRRTAHGSHEARFADLLIFGDAGSGVASGHLLAVNKETRLVSRIQPEGVGPALGDEDLSLPFDSERLG